eukprot:CAMPEP_0182904584 /NCGR_PEP_ID=MMETSP0034_2-20130328/32224_1 /TAXON_ID=156128 /ORGANISM="Nephroselmis pyriformis, Strain CCMP717" /LENGTH=625 /DNA_ID=CAMNT_0025039769 /DNA_START=333 /DNA_END=2207 /DNA_ORIENTATION=+
MEGLTRAIKLNPSISFMIVQASLLFNFAWPTGLAGAASTSTRPAANKAPQRRWGLLMSCTAAFFALIWAGQLYSLGDPSANAAASGQCAQFGSNNTAAILLHPEVPYTTACLSNRASISKDYVLEYLKFVFSASSFNDPRVSVMDADADGDSTGVNPNLIAESDLRAAEPTATATTLASPVPRDTTLLQVGGCIWNSKCSQPVLLDAAEYEVHERMKSSDTGSRKDHLLPTPIYKVAYFLELPPLLESSDAQPNGMPTAADIARSNMAALNSPGVSSNADPRAAEPTAMVTTMALTNPHDAPLLGIGVDAGGATVGKNFDSDENTTATDAALHHPEVPFITTSLSKRASISKGYDFEVGSASSFPDPRVSLMDADAVGDFPDDRPTSYAESEFFLDHIMRLQSIHGVAFKGPLASTTEMSPATGVACPGDDPPSSLHCTCPDARLSAQEKSPQPPESEPQALGCSGHCCTTLHRSTCPPDLPFLCDIDQKTSQPEYVLLSFVWAILRPDVPLGEEEELELKLGESFQGLQPGCHAVWVCTRPGPHCDHGDVKVAILIIRVLFVVCFALIVPVILGLATCARLALLSSSQRCSRHLKKAWPRPTRELRATAAAAAAAIIVAAYLLR